MQFSATLVLHVCAGALALLSGTIAVCVRKGSRNHRAAGIVFSIAMMTLAATGVVLAYSKSQTGNVLAGILTFYMVSTAWIAGRRRVLQINLFDWIGFLIALAVGIYCLTYGFKVANGRSNPNDGVPAGMDFFLGSIVLIAAAGDLRMIIRGGISGASRIARHLWRMCFGLFIASGSFFMGRQKLFPYFIRKSNILMFLTILPLLLLAFWMVRVLGFRREDGSLTELQR